MRSLFFLMHNTTNVWLEKAAKWRRLAERMDFLVWAIYCDCMADACERIARGFNVQFPAQPR